MIHVCTDIGVSAVPPWVFISIGLLFFIYMLIEYWLGKSGLGSVIGLLVKIVFKKGA